MKVTMHKSYKCIYYLYTHSTRSVTEGKKNQRPISMPQTSQRGEQQQHCEYVKTNDTYL